MPFNPDRVVASLSTKELNSLKKSEIVTIAKHFHIEFQSTMRKDDIKRVIAEHLFNESFCLVPNLRQ
ncbi:hypothetical protein HOLleu_35532 [Holothuria leucospilota]|uniref:Uncharacterized protein n=1 Tax=Holothuria leucospilota TaxID=206669 RepID=A0A9Q0YM80_HOLLE|nr:hypothetical protein HOLleu_35532 [Holothuria leucospilota]